VTTSGGDPAANDDLAGIMSIWRGCVASGTPYEQLGNNTGTSTSMTGTAVTTSGNNEFILNFCVSSDIATGSTPSAGWTETYDLDSFSGVADASLKCYSIVKASAGALA